MTTKNRAVDDHVLLQNLGFGEYEARAYLSLIGAGSRNGYEVAKATGMPRANVYAVLERLVIRGAARRLGTPDGVRYAAVAPARLLARMEREHRRKLAAAKAVLEHSVQGAELAPVFNLRGHDELMKQARADIEAAQETLLVAIQPPEAAALAEPLHAARERGVAITTLCMEGCAAECGGCLGDIHRCPLAPNDGVRWLLLVADARHMLAGEIFPARTRAVATDQSLVVALAASYIRQSIALATVAGDLGERFYGLLSEEACRILDALHLEDGLLAPRERARSGQTV